MQHNTQYARSNAIVWRGPDTNMNSLTIYVKQDGLLYCGMPRSKYIRISSLFLLIYPVYRLHRYIDRTPASGLLYIISLAALILFFIFYFVGLNEMMRMRATLTDINNLIKQPLSRTVLICGVNQIINKKKHYLVNCVTTRIKPNGELLPQKAEAMIIKKNYYGVEALIQEFIALQKHSRSIEA
jgi:hypothetical protein